MERNYFYKDKLTSERLITKFLTYDDAAMWSTFFEDEEAIKFLPTFGLTNIKERATYWIKRQLNRYEKKEFGLQALINKNSNEFIGQCGLIQQEVDGKIEIEVGYHILKKYWGQGFASEAAKLFIDFAFANNLANSIISIIDINNLKSQKVAAKNGLIKEKQTNWNDVEVFIYRI